MADFVTPEFLQKTSADDFHKIMLDSLPVDLDKSSGSHVWNLTRPTALIAAEICEFYFPEVLQLAFPAYAYGSFLDAHATTRNITRRAAVAATGKITITGTPGATIPAGSRFSTESINDEPSVDYMTLAEATIEESGSVTVEIECMQTGPEGNTPAGTIVIVSSKLSGITAVTNEEEVSGGTEAESDDSLRARISEYDQSLGLSFVGNVGDYIRWAKSVDGVGTVTVIPAQDNSGEVTIIVIDSNGDPATTNLLESVYNYIMSPDEPANRLAPIGATLTVSAPDTKAVSIRATVELKADATIDTVIASFLAQVASYLPKATEDGEVKYTRLAAILAASEGVNDYKDFLIGTKSDDGVTYGTSNIAITSYQLPTVAKDDLLLTAGTV